MGDLIQFVPRSNPDRLSIEDRRAIALHEYVASAGYPVDTGELKGVMSCLKAEMPDTSPSEMNTDGEGA
jgi:hypothetical protein